MIAQRNFQFRSKRPADLIVVTPKEVVWLENQLRGKGWQTAAELGAKTEHQKRKLRLIVEHSSGSILSYPGSPGYKLYDEATITEIHRSVALRVQGRVMLRRYLSYMRRLHKRTESIPQELFPTQ